MLESTEILGIKEKIEDFEPDLREKSKQKIEYLIIPKTQTAKNQLEAVYKKEKRRLSLTWRGGRKSEEGKWSNPATLGYSITEQKKVDLLELLEETGIPVTEIEFREISPPSLVPTHIRSATRIAELGDQYEQALQAVISKEKEEIKRAKDLLDNDDISAADYVERVREISERYALEKKYLEGHQNRNWKAADAIYDEGESKKASVEAITEEDVINEFNARFSILEHPFGILESYGGVFSIQSKRDFKDRFQNQRIQVTEKKSVFKADVWLDSPSRRTFFKMEFRPDKPSGEYIEDGRRFLNLWKGFSIEPKKGNCKLIKQHMRNVICAGKQENFEYLWKLESHWVQHPQDRTVVPVFRSAHGAGKGRHTDMFEKIFGDSYLETSQPEHVFGNFNASIANKVLIHLDDAIFGGDKRLMGKLKTFSTAQKINIEFKNKDAIEVHNPRKLMISSNEDFAIPVEPTERRYFFLDVSNEKIGKAEYFVRLTEEMENGGIAAFLYELQQTDLTGFNPKQLPDGPQAYGFDNKIASADSFIQFLFSSLEQETFFLDLATGTWCEEIRTDVLDEQYAKFCKSRQLRLIASKLTGKTLKKFFGPIEFSKYRPRYEGIPKWTYKIPPLEKCKNAFAAYFRTTERCAFGLDEDGEKQDWSVE